MMKTSFTKLLTTAIILLFIGIVYAPSITANNNSGVGNTIYVDDDNTDGPWDGTLEHPYQYIQDGVDNASNRDVVYVYGGMYNENIHIDKSLDLIGEKSNNPIIHSKDDSFFSRIMIINGTKINVNGFEIGNNKHANYGIWINEKSSGITISDNVINCKSTGISVDSAYNIRIIHNIFTNLSTGIILARVIKAMIKENHFFGTTIDSIRLGLSSNIIIQENIIDETKGACAIEMWFNFNTRLKRNSFSDNRYGLAIYYSYFTRIEENNFINNGNGDEEFGQAAIFVSYFNRWKRNYWDDWNGTGPYIINGIQFKRDYVNYDWLPAREPYDISILEVP